MIANDGNSLSPAIMQASQDGIPTLAYDRMINNCDIAHYITFDLEKVGRMQAEGVLDVTNKGRFYYLGGSPTDNNARFFRKGTMDALKPYIDRGDIELIGEQFTKDWLPDVALQIIEDMLTAQKNNVTAIVAANDAIGGAAIQALKAQGLAGKVPVSGQDADLAALQRIAKGEQAVTVYKPIKQIAIECAKAAVALAKEESVESNSSLNNGYKDVPTFYIEPIKVTKDNLDSLMVKGLPVGTKVLFGGNEIELYPDGSAHLTDTKGLAGSTLHVNDGLRILVEKAMVPWQTAINACTLNPARMLNVDDRKGSIQTGKDADLVVLNDDYSVEMTYTKGTKAF